MRLLEERVQADTVKEIDLADVDPADRIVIETRNSLYEFSVLDANQLCGVLSGGRLTEDISDVVLMGTLSAESGGCEVDYISLKTDARAFFYIKSARGVERLITSAITGLMLIKGGLGTPSLV